MKIVNKMMNMINKIEAAINKVILISSSGVSSLHEVKLYLGSLISTIINSIGMSVLLVPVLFITGIFEKYVLTDRGFLEIMLILFILDILTGASKHIKNRTFSASEFAIKFLVKILVSLVFMIGFNALSLISSFQDSKDLVRYFVLLGQMANGIYIFSSVLKNLHSLTDGKFPPVSLINRTKEFNKNLDVTAFVKGKVKSEEATD